MSVARLVVCPKCGAGVKMPCTSPIGTPVVDHAERSARYREFEREQMPRSARARLLNAAPPVMLEPGLTKEEVLYRYTEAEFRRLRRTESVADSLGISRETLYNWLKRWGVKLRKGELSVGVSRVAWPDTAKAR